MPPESQRSNGLSMALTQARPMETSDGAEFVAALGAHFAEGFVTKLAAVGEDSKDYLVLCKRDADGSQASLCLSVSNCISGIFSRSLCEKELAEMRHEAGMAEFGWNGFLKLFASALRCEGGCSAGIEVKQEVADLTLRFQLQAATLVSRVKLDRKAFVGCSDSAPCGADKAALTYLGELRRFVVAAVDTAAASPAPAASAAGLQATQHNAVGHRVASLSETPNWRSLPGLGNSSSASAAQAFGALGTDGNPAARRPPVTAPAAKKRAGTSLVDPGARRVPRAGANPFQLSR